jgi:MoaA/NifB/PqqE/SkfB family radical SAM enzyme
MTMPHKDATPFARPYVVSWNLTYRCNLACEHCYLDAGGTPLVGTENFADRSELGTAECFRVIDEIAAFAPECLTILTGGEPLLRRDILEIIRRASERELWVVVGTNGVSITENLAKRLAEAGARGLSLSLDALDPDCHDRFRRVRGAWQNTVQGAEILNRTGLPFIVQTTAGSHNLGDLEAIADFAHDRLGAKVWNLYFLVPTGRGQFVSDMTPAQYDEVLDALYRIQRKYDRRMLVNAKCAPHYIKTVLENGDTDSRIFKRVRVQDGLSYGVGSAFQAASIDPNSTFIVYAIFAPQNLAKVRAATADEIAKARDGGFTEQEVAAARKALLEERRIARAQDDALASSLVAQEFLGRTWAQSAKIDAAIGAVTVQSANAALRKYIDPTGIGYAFAGDFAKK